MLQGHCLFLSTGVPMVCCLYPMPGNEPITQCEICLFLLALVGNAGTVCREKWNGPGCNYMTTWHVFFSSSRRKWTRSAWRIFVLFIIAWTGIIRQGLRRAVLIIEMCTRQLCSLAVPLSTVCCQRQGGEETRSCCWLLVWDVCTYVLTHSDTQRQWS